MSEESIVDLFESSDEPSGSERETAETTTEEPEVKQDAEIESPESNAEPQAKEDGKEVTATSEEDKEKQEWTFHAVKDERAKRQAAEARLKELEDKLNSNDKQDIPDVIDDQDGFVKSLKQQQEEALTRQRIEIFRQVQQESHPDYEEKEQKFIELAKENPVLITQMNASQNPAKFVYDQMTKYEQFQEMQDIEAFREKIRAEEKAKLEEQLKSEEPTSLSPSLAKARGSSDNTEKLPEDPGDLF